MSSYSVSPSSSLLREGSSTFCNSCGGSLPITTNFSENVAYIIKLDRRICKKCADYFMYKSSTLYKNVHFSLPSYYCGTCSLEIDNDTDRHTITYKFGPDKIYFGAMLVCKNCIEVLPVLEKINIL